MDGVLRIQGGIPTVDATMGRKGMDGEKVCGRGGVSK